MALTSYLKRNFANALIAVGILGTSVGGGKMGYDDITGKPVDPKAIGGLVVGQALAFGTLLAVEEAESKKRRQERAKEKSPGPSL